MSDKNTFAFLKGTAQRILYLLMGMALFAAFSIAIFLVRSRDSARMIMPDLTGKYYTDVHNDMMQAQLRITIVKKSFPDKMSGVILYQSIPAGSSISTKEKLYVVVNQPEPLLIVPDMVGNSLSAARSALTRITFNEEVFSLEIAAVSTLPTKDVTAGTVLAQFPPGNEVVSIKDKVFLLVSGDAGTPAADFSEYRGQSIAVLQELFSRSGQEYRIKKIERPPVPELNGQVFAIERSSTNVLLLSVYFREPDVRFQNGFEKISWEASEKGECRAYQTGMQTEAPERRTFFLSKNHAEDEEIQLIFYRIGESDVKVECGSSVMFHDTIEPDDMG